MPAIVDEIETDNIFSHRVLENNGMKKFKEIGKLIWLKLVST